MLAWPSSSWMMAVAETMVLVVGASRAAMK